MDKSATGMLRAWGCIHRCGKTVFGAQAGSFREYAKDPGSDIVEVFIVTPKGRIPSARSSSGIPEGFEVKVHLAAEAFGGGPQIVDRYWKLITLYPDKKLIKHIRPDGSSRVEVEKA